MIYDLLIIGGSAAATSAGIYAARRNLNFKIISKDIGGEVATSGEIGNWPGISHTDGIALAKQFKDHLASYKIEIEDGVEVKKIIRREDGSFSVAAGDGQNYEAKAVIVATGVHPKELNLTGEKEFRGKGVSYCTVCDGPMFGGKVTATIGGGNSVLESALMLADIASKVYLINKNPQFKGDQILIDKVMAKKNVEIIYNAKTSQMLGENFVNGLKYIGSDGEEKELKVEGIFVHIGMIPNSGLVTDDVAKNSFGEIITDKNCMTNIPGLFAAGDVTDVAFKQIVIAAGQGTIALLSAVNYLNKLK